MIVLDPLYFIIIAPGLILAIYAQYKVKSTVKKFNRVPTMGGMTGAMAARKILDGFGLQDVGIELSRGWLSDHYDPKSRTLRLSKDIYHSNSVAAVGIAAHEAGHALQHSTGYSLLAFRNAIVPTASLGSWLAFPLMVIGAIFSIKGLVLGGLALFSIIVIFQVLTLPVELDASKRAKKLVTELGVTYSDVENAGVSKVLNAAALTYLAATITAVLQLLYFATIFLGDD
jgi:uncharacterized protein